MPDLWAVPVREKAELEAAALLPKPPKLKAAPLLAAALEAAAGQLQILSFARYSRNVNLRIVECDPCGLEEAEKREHIACLIKLLLRMDRVLQSV